MNGNPLLITRPNYDLATHYLFHWSSFVIKEADNKGFKVLDLKGKKANKKKFDSYIKRQKPILVFFNGHGSEAVITGHDDEILVKAGKDEKLLSGKIVYARCCEAAKRLGQRCVQKDTWAFVGYKRKYILGYAQSKISQPLKDKVAKLFLKPSNLIPISLLKGNTVNKAYKKSQKAMWWSFRFMLSSRASEIQRDAAPYLWANRKCQTLLGNEKARL